MAERKKSGSIAFKPRARLLKLIGAELISDDVVAITELVKNAHDADAAADFYTNLFGWNAEKQETGGGPPYWVFKLGGRQAAGLGQMSDEMKSQGIPPTWNSYVAVENVETTANQVAELGGTVTFPPLQIPGAGWMAFLQDPGGANLAIWQKDQHSSTCSRLQGR